MNDDRTRTYTWADTRVGLESLQRLSGLEFLNGIIAGTIPPPPIANTMGFGLAEVAKGRAVFAVQPAEYHYNPIGSVHGGLAATLLDSAMGCAVHTVLEAGVGYTTVDLHITYAKALRSTSAGVRATGEVVHHGGRVVSARGEIRDADGVLYAHGITTCLVLKPEKR